MKILKRQEALIVIHNLKEFERKVQVDNYIKEILLNSSTFDLTPNTEINKDIEIKNWEFYYEPNYSPKIFHVIFAKEGTEAGYYYNEDSIKFILNKANDVTQKRPFDIINSIKDTFCSVSESILEEPLNNEEIIIEKNKRIKLNNNEKKIKLKKCLIDEIGFSNFISNGFEPKYEYYRIGENLIINLEMPGNYKDTNIIKESKGSYTYINISGIKLTNKEYKLEKNYEKDNSFNSIEYGEFHTTIKLEDIVLEPTPETKISNGIVSLIYKITQKAPVVKLFD